MMQRHEEFDVLDELRKHGPLPHQLEQRHQQLRRQQFFKAGLQCDHYPPSSPADILADMTIAEWLKERWSSADKTVRHSLRLLADALGIPLPLRRTHRVRAKDSSPARRTRPALHTSHGEPAPLDSLAKKYGLDYHDPPQWDDDDADGWEPVESLRDAFRSDDRGWY